jgi:F5/8 type C domain
MSEKETPSKQENTSTEKPRTRGIVKFFMWSIYIAFLLAIVVGLLASVEYYAYLQVKASPMGQAYKGKDLDLARRSSQVVAPLYGYEPTPGFASIRNTRLGNAYEYINEESFKDFDGVPREKPEGEYRVFVTGGSVVYGRGPVPPSDRVTDYYEVTYRWTIPHIMEKLLNADPRVREKTGAKTVRVINAGVAGYIYQNSLMRYLAKMRLFEPDLVVALDGANEVHTVARPLKDWNYFTEGQYYEVTTDTMDMGRRGLMNYLTLWLKRNTYFFTWLAFRRGEGPGTIIEDRGFAAHPQDPTPEMIEFRKRNIGQVADAAAMYHKVLETDGIPHILALQPMFRNCKKKRTPMEERIEQITGMRKIGFYDAAETYDLLVEQVKSRVGKAGLDVVDLTEIFDPVTEWVFTDWCHLTNGANYMIAKELVNRVKQDVLGLELLPDDPLREPLDSYLIDYSKQAKVFADGQPVDQGLHVLKGYPGEQLLEVKNAKGDAHGNVVLDLGKVLPISRLRVVWGDQASVPAGWKIELSEDGKNWNDWIAVTKTETDSFDQWPGYEYYAPKETSARYARYSQTAGAGSGLIRLRQVSLFR